MRLMGFLYKFAERYQLISLVLEYNAKTVDVQVNSICQDYQFWQLDFLYLLQKVCQSSSR